MNIKTCNIRSIGFDYDILDSLSNSGFVVLDSHHGVDLGLIREVQHVWREFFLSTPENRDEFVNQTDLNMGYMGFKQEKAVGAKVADLKHHFHWKPNEKAPFEAIKLTQSLFYQLEDLSATILGVLDSGYPGRNFREMCNDSTGTLLRILHYPALDYSLEPGAVRSAPHEDIGFITLLVAASAPGLQVKDNDGNWIDVPFETNSIVVNVGDSLQLASNRYFKSTTHRVVNANNSTDDRISIPLFVHPKNDSILAQGITAQDYLNERLNTIYKTGYKKESK